MKVRVTYTVEVRDEFRRAIRHHYGEKGLATRQEVREWFEAYGDSESAEILSNLELEEHPDEDQPYRRKF